MADAIISWNPEHDAAAIRWSRRPNDFPIDAINPVLRVFYDNSDLGPYLYEVYDRDDETLLGMLVAANFTPENAAEIRALFSDIVNRDGVAPETEGPFGRKVVTV